MKNVSYSLRHLTISLPVGSAVWGDLGGLTLFAGHMSLEAGFESLKTHTTSGFLCLLYACSFQNVSSQDPVSDTMLFA